MVVKGSDSDEDEAGGGNDGDEQLISDDEEMMAPHPDVSAVIEKEEKEDESDQEPPEEVCVEKSVAERHVDVGVEAPAETRDATTAGAESASPSPTSGEHGRTPFQRPPSRETRPRSRQADVRAPPPYRTIPGTSFPIRLVRKSQRPPTLLERLLTGEIREERSELLQCVKYICENNFFDEAVPTTPNYCT